MKATSKVAERYYGVNGEMMHRGLRHLPPAVDRGGAAGGRKLSRSPELPSLSSSDHQAEWRSEPTLLARRSAALVTRGRRRALEASPLDKTAAGVERRCCDASNCVEPSEVAPYNRGLFPLRHLRLSISAPTSAIRKPFTRTSVTSSKDSPRTSETAINPFSFRKPLLLERRKYPVLGRDRLFFEAAALYCHDDLANDIEDLGIPKDMTRRLAPKASVNSRPPHHLPVGGHRQQ